MRPGEKLTEELFHSEESLAETQYEKILLAESRPLKVEGLVQGLADIERACEAYEHERVRELAIGLVPEYLEDSGVSGGHPSEAA